MKTFHNQVVWITGASSGYGKAMAAAFVNAGAKVILSARRADKLAEVASQLDSTRHNTRALPLDLSQPETFAAKTKEAIAAFGHVDMLVHNGAIAQSGSALETMPEVARQIMEVDYFSYTELTQHMLPHFIAQKSGHIVVVSGLLARITLPGRSSYAAAKAALFGYFGCLRAELVGRHIDVTLLVPGAMQTELTTKALKADGTIAGGDVSTAGCPVEVAAEQSLQAIANKVYEAYIGDEQGSKMWQLSLQNPEKSIEMLLKRIQAQQK